MGVIGDNQKIRIGNTQTNAFIKGIYGITPIGILTETVIINPDGEMGSISTTIGDVTGPGSSTDNAIVRFDDITGKIIQNSILQVSFLAASENDSKVKITFWKFLKIVKSIFEALSDL